MIMKRNLLIMTALLCGVMAGSAQKLDNAATVRKAAPAAKMVTFANQPKQTANAFQFKYGARPFYSTRRAAAGDISLMYSYPSNALFYDLTDESSSYVNMRAVTGAFEDVTYDNYSRIYDTDTTRVRLKDVTWKFLYEAEEGEEAEEVEPMDSTIAEDGSLIAQGYGFYPFPTVFYGDQSYTYKTEDTNNCYWMAGSDSIITFNFRGDNDETEKHSGTIGNAPVQLGFYSGYSNGGSFTTGENFLTLDDYMTTQDWTDTGKKLVGFAEYYEKPSGLIQAQEIVIWLWSEELDALRPFGGKELKATIYTWDEEGTRQVYAEAVATSKNMTKVGDNGLVYISFKFEEEDELLGTIEAPVVLPDEDFLVVISGFEQMKKGKFTAPFSPADGYDGHGYALLDDGSFATIGYSNEPQTPQMSLHIDFRAAIPVAHYADSNLEEVIFYKEGGLGVGQYDEEEDQAYGYVLVSTMSRSEMWEEIDVPDWVTYEMVDDYIEDRGIMPISFEAEPLPEGVFEREGEAVFELFGKELRIKLYQFDEEEYARGIDTMKYNLNKSSKTYNMAGQLVNDSYKGLVIKNGKKYLMK